MKKLGFGFMRLSVLDENDRSTVDIELVKKMIDRFMERGFPTLTRHIAIMAFDMEGKQIKVKQEEDSE